MQPLRAESSATTDSLDITLAQKPARKGKLGLALIISVVVHAVLITAWLVLGGAGHGDKADTVPVIAPPVKTAPVLRPIAPPVVIPAPAAASSSSAAPQPVLKAPAKVVPTKPVAKAKAPAKAKAKPVAKAKAKPVAKTKASAKSKTHPAPAKPAKAKPAHKPGGLDLEALSKMSSKPAH